MGRRRTWAYQIKSPGLIHRIADKGASGKLVCSIVNEERVYLVLGRAGEALATRGDLNILCFCIKQRDPGCGLGSMYFSRSSTDWQCPEGPLLRHPGPGAGDRAGTALAVRHSCSAHGTTCKQTCSAKFVRNDSKTTHLGVHRSS